MAYVLAFDFGGTKLAAGVVDRDNGSVRGYTRHVTPQDAGAAASMDRMIQAGEEALSASGLGLGQLTAVGISFGGPVSRDRRSVLRSMHITGWEAVDLADWLEQQFGCPAFMDNDANAAALGEWRFGAGRGSASMLYVQVSTGIGAGLILDGRLYRGGGLAGEFGHTPVRSDGLLCSCGQSDCLETLAAGWALKRKAQALMTQGELPILAGLTGGDPERLSAELLLRAAELGEPAALQAVDGAFRSLGRALIQAVCLLDPEVIVLGGGVTRARHIIGNIIQAELYEYTPRHLRGRAPIAFAQLDGQETLVGAALLSQGY